MKRIMLALAAAMALVCFAAPKIQMVSTPGMAIVMNLSDNGRWAVAVNSGEDDDNPGVIIDTATGDWTDIPVPAGSAGAIADVTDDGSLVVGSLDNIPAYWSASGGWTLLPLPDGCVAGRVNAVTPDGRYAVGQGRPDEFEEVGALWDLLTGELLETPGLPVLDMTGEDQHQNRFSAISPDGRYILGTKSFSYLLPTGIFQYVYDRETQEYTAIGFTPDPFGPWTPLAEGLLFTCDGAMSANGRYVTGVAYMVKEIAGSEFPDEYRTAFLYDVVSKEFTVYDSATDRSGIYGMSVDNEGNILGTAPATTPLRDWYVRANGYWYPILDVMKQRYNIDLQTVTMSYNTGTPIALSGDGLTVGVFTDPQGEGYLLTVDEPLVESCAGVDLLANYSASPAAGSAFSTLTSVTVAFDRAVDLLGGKTDVKLLDADGSAIKQSMGIAVEGGRVTITFRPTPLTAGKEYTLLIPAGLVSVAGDSRMTNREIRICYSGRQQAPVSVVSAYPAPGSALAMLDYANSQIILTFDTSLTFTGSEHAALYAEGSNSPLCELYMAADGNKLYLFPLTTQYLYDGARYRVVLEAGSVADAGGEGANQKWEAEYDGSYVRQVSPDDKYIFRDDFSTGLSGFMFYEGDGNTPSEDMEEWGFTADSTPWWIARDSMESDDYYAVSHSDYVPAGRSDDWMVTPRLYIPDDICRLTFDVQSYRAGKHDRLKVYVIPCETVYNTLTDAAMAELRPLAQLVYDEELSPGANAEITAGEWTPVEVSLAAWAGKDVYIAFVNDNEAASAIFVDNITVIHDVQFLVSISADETAVALDAIEIGGYIKVDDEGALYDSLSLRLRDGNGALVSLITADGLALTADSEPYEFTFPDLLPLTVGEVNPYTVEVTLGDETLTVNRSLKNMAFATTRRVVIEEYSGATCGNCPAGFIAMEHIGGIVGDKLIPVVIRTYGNDPLHSGLGGYTQYLGLESFGAPSASIDRVYSPVGPLSQTESGAYSFTGAPGSPTWLDCALDRLAVMPDADLDFSVGYDESTGQLTIPVDVTWAITMPSVNVALMAVILEDDLRTNQLNYFNESADPLIGDWGSGGAYGSYTVRGYTIDNVARGVIANTYGGTLGLLPGSVEGGQRCHAVIEGALSAYVTNPAKTRVALLMIDANTGAIINANVAPLGGSGLTLPGGDKPLIEILPGAISITLAGDISAELYAIDGRLIASAAGRDALTLRAPHAPTLAILRVNGAAYKVALR